MRTTTAAIAVWVGLVVVISACGYESNADTVETTDAHPPATALTVGPLAPDVGPVVGPDPAVLQEYVEGTFQIDLLRDPRPGEVEYLVDVWLGYYQASARIYAETGLTINPDDAFTDYFADSYQRELDVLADPAPVAVYVPLDPATIRVAIRDLFFRVLERNPTDDELREFTAAYQRLHREGFNAALEGKVFDVNARFDELFWDRYTPLIELRRQREENREARENLLDSIERMDDLIRDGTGY